MLLQKPPPRSNSVPRHRVKVDTDSQPLFILFTPIGLGLVVVFGCVWWRVCFVVGSVSLPSLTFLYVTVV